MATIKIGVINKTVHHQSSKVVRTCKLEFAECLWELKTLLQRPEVFSSCFCNCG